MLLGFGSLPPHSLLLLRRRRQQQAWIAVIDTERRRASFLFFFSPPLFSFCRGEAAQPDVVRLFKNLCKRVCGVKPFLNNKNVFSLFHIFSALPKISWLIGWAPVALLFCLSVCLCLRANTRGQNFFFFWWEEEDGKRERAERPTQPGLKVSMPLTTCVFLSSLFAVFVCMCTACVCHSVHLPTSKRTAKGPSGRKKGCRHETQLPLYSLIRAYVFVRPTRDQEKIPHLPKNYAGNGRN